MPIRFDLYAPDVLADPYPLYHALRKQAPVWRGPQGQWVVTRYADVTAALHDPRLSAGVIDVDRAQSFPEPLRASVESMMRPLETFLVAKDPPDHTRLRGLVNKGLTPHAVEALRPAIRARVDALLGRIVARADPATGTGQCDIIQDFAFLLPVTIVGLLLGLPEGDHQRFREWAYDLSILWGPPNVPDVEERVRRCESSVAALTAYFRDVIARRRAQPGNDLVSALLGAADHGAPLSDAEVLWNCVLMLLAGHETVTDLIGNGLLALIRFPAEWQKLRADVSLVPNAVEELLRYDAPFQFMNRLAKEPLEIAGTKVAAGERVWLMLGAANRDPGVFPDPDRLDVTRAHFHQIAFGQGVHFCPGAPLARLEGQIAFDALVRRFTEFRLATDRLHWLPKIPNRGLQELPVTFHCDVARP
jgi:cytochrome P450